MARRRKNKVAGSKPAKSRFPKFTINLSWIKPPGSLAVRRGSIAAAWLIFSGALVGGWIWGVPQLQAKSARQRSVDPNEVTICFVDQPGWVKGDLADTLMRTAQANIGGNPMVRDDLIAVRESLLQTGWFNSIDQVRRVDADAVEIAADYVRPAALVRDKDGNHFIDLAGKLLPKSFKLNDLLPVYRDLQTKKEYSAITIIGAQFSRPQAPGMQWEGTDVGAGIRLLQVIDSQPWRDQVIEIDVSGYLKDLPIKLRTDKGCTIIWGGPPGEEPALETLADAKLQRLQFIYDRSGRIDAGRFTELDLTLQDGVFARDLESQLAASGS